MKNESVTTPEPQFIKVLEIGVLLATGILSWYKIRELIREKAEKNETT